MGGLPSSKTSSDLLKVIKPSNKKLPLIPRSAWYYSCVCPKVKWGNSDLRLQFLN
jgi:hypothetical protein